MKLLRVKLLQLEGRCSPSPGAPHTDPPGPCERNELLLAHSTGDMACVVWGAPALPPLGLPWGHLSQGRSRTVQFVPPGLLLILQVGKVRREIFLCVRTPIRAGSKEEGLYGQERRSADQCPCT